MRAFLSYGAAWNWLKEAGRKERAEQVRVSNPELSAEVDRLMGQPESALRHLDWQLRRLIGGDPVEQLISGVQGFEGIVNRLPSKDIWQFKDAAALAQAVEETRATPSRAELQETFREGYRRIGESPE